MRLRRYHYKKKNININDFEKTREDAQDLKRRDHSLKKKSASSKLNVKNFEEIQEDTQDSERRDYSLKKKSSSSKSNVKNMNAVMNNMQRFIMHEFLNRECEFDHLKFIFNLIHLIFVTAHSR